MGEVGRAGVDLGRLARLAELAEQRRLPMPLLGERHLVLALAARDELLPDAFEITDDRRFTGRGLARRGFEHLAHACKERQLLVDDRVRQELSSKA
jgi:hypothetical protein